MNWKIEDLFLDLKYTWKIARSATNFKHNLLVILNQNGFTSYGEVAPNARYGEDAELLKQQFHQFTKVVDKQEINTIDQLHFYMKKVPLAQSLKFGIESSWFKIKSQEENKSITDIFNLTSSIEVPTAYSIPIIPFSELTRFFEEYNVNRFQYLKVKINSLNGVELTNELTKLTKVPLIIDANEAFKDIKQFLIFQESITYPNVMFIEQPFPADQIIDYQKLKNVSKYQIFGDESLISNPNFDLLASQFHGVNMKLMKAGGFLEGIQILENAKRYGLRTMIGCMIESTLGIRDAFDISSLADIHDLDGFLVVNNEPFNLIQENCGILRLPKE